MSSPEAGLPQRKEAILQRSPLLRTFLNARHLREDPTRWYIETALEYTPLINELDTKAGKVWRPLITQTHLLSSVSQQVFRPDIKAARLATVVEGLLLVGYELGDGKDIALFISDLVQSLGEEGINVSHPDVARNPAARMMMVNTVTGLLVSGVWLKRVNLSKAEAKSNEPTNLPKSVEDFLQGLDYSDM